MAQQKKKPKPRVKTAVERVQRLLDFGQQGSEVDLEFDRRLEREGYWFERRLADRVQFFFERFLCHGKGELRGTALRLEPWQLRNLRRVFGWCRPDGTRRYRRFDLWVPRKNGKSTLAAGTGLYLLTGDGEPGARVYALAGNEDQATEVFGEAKDMCNQAPVLARMCNVYTSSIFEPLKASRFEVCSSKPDTKHGFNPSGTVCDEIHVWPNRDLFDVFATAVIARRQPLMHVISTAGNDIESFGHRMFETAVQAQEGVLQDPEYHSSVFAAKPTDDIEDPATWAKANPNIGVSVKLDGLKTLWKETIRDPSFLPTFKRLHLNLWSQEAEAWLSIDAWNACAKKKRGLEKFRGRSCYAGLDLSSNTDLTTLQLTFPCPDESFDVLSFFWCPEVQAEQRAKRDRVPYPLWIEQKWVESTPGNVIDYKFIVRKLVWLRDECGIDILQVAYDRWGASKISQDLQDEHGFTMVEFGQGFKSMSEPAKLLERLVLSRKIRHEGSPVMTWNVANVRVKRDDADNVKPVKEDSKSRRRIDGVVALVMALARASLGEGGPSVYEERGMIVI